MALTDVLHARKLREELDATKAALQSTLQRVEQANTQLANVEAERDQLKKLLAETDRLSLVELQAAIAQLEARKAKGTREMENLRQLYHQRKQAVEEQLRLLSEQVAARQKDLVMMDEEELLQSFGLYTRQYELQSSEMYKAQLDAVCAKQAAMVKSGGAAICPKDWTVNGSTSEGKRMIKDYTKLILRSFNNECEATIAKVKFSNVDATEKRIRKAHEALNRLAKVMEITLTDAYLRLKLDELHLAYEYQVKKQEEKDEQKRIREELREQARVAKEIEEERQRLAKEEKHFAQALDAVRKRLADAGSDADREGLLAEQARIEAQVQLLEASKLSIEMRERNTRAGYVYVISNIGSFGEDVYKIGMTRRLEPEERVDELGDASVPFDFDIHAMVFSEDAPALENAIHRAFEKQKLNMVNSRREFFRVSLDEIERVVRTNFQKPVEFVAQPEAPQYRQSLMMRDEAARHKEAASPPLGTPTTLPDVFA